MGQKVHPYGFRLGYNKDWHSHWFAKKQFGDFLIEDLKLKAELKRRFTGAGVSHVDVERAANRLKIIIYTSRPGIIIGRKGSEIDKLKGDISSRTGREVLVSIQEIHKPELNAQLQAEKIAAQLEKRIAFRRAMRKAVEEEFVTQFDYTRLNEMMIIIRQCNCRIITQEIQLFCRMVIAVPRNRLEEFRYKLDNLRLGENFLEKVPK